MADIPPDIMKAADAVAMQVYRENAEDLFEARGAMFAVKAAIAGAILAEREACAKLAEGWPTQPRAGGEYQTDGNRFWDAGTVYDQGRVDAAAAIRSRKGA